ncbi:hypothetical protein AB0B21_28955 [Streptomyces rimosus]|uniref:hypothetical protein n=1 Tax=Streptomyces rimosus TaxID=1927 RepID=UPI00067CE253|nr:hypothetical protein [Streptomyces rimosus]
MTATGGGGLQLNTTTISVGVNVQITSGTFTMPSGGVAVAFRNATMAGIGSASTGVINVPSGVANGDMLLLAIALEETRASPAVTGWT